jgi:hypothetical protein
LSFRNIRISHLDCCCTVRDGCIDGLSERVAPGGQHLPGERAVFSQKITN